MDNSLDYGHVIQKNLQAATAVQPRLQKIQIYPVCDLEAGHFLILATGWEQQTWINSILFQAHLINGNVVIQEDNFEASVTEMLIEAGIPADCIKASPYPYDDQTAA